MTNPMTTADTSAKHSTGPLMSAGKFKVRAAASIKGSPAMTTADAKAMLMRRRADAESLGGQTEFTIEEIDELVTALEASPNSRTEAMIEAGLKAFRYYYDHLDGGEDYDQECVEAIYTAMQSARSIDQQEAVERCDFCNYPLPAHSDICTIFHEQRKAETPEPGPIAPVQDESWLAPDEEAELADRINGNWYLQPNDPVQDDDAEGAK